MKTSMTLAALFLASLLGSGCATISKLNAEFEEEEARIARLSPAEKQAWDEEQKYQERLRVFEDTRDGEGDD